MAISIPALLDAQLDALQVTMRPVEDGATFTDSFSAAPYVRGNRVADIVRLFTDLCNSGTLTGVGVHTAADATNNISVAPLCTDQAEANTLLNALDDGTGESGGGMSAHFLIVGSNEHIGADVTSDLSGAVAATTLGTSITLANLIKEQFNIHLALNGATGHYGPELTNKIRSPDASDLASVIVLANELRTKYNAHCANIKAGSVNSVIDNAAITTVNSLIGATITFAGNVTTALAGLTRVINSNTVNHAWFMEALPAAPAVGDTFTIDWSTVDASLDQLTGSKGMGNSQSDPYGPGPSLINALMIIIEQLGGTLPAYMDVSADAEPFSIGSPQAGGGSLGSGGLILIADALEVMRTTIAAWTVPA